MKFYALKLFIFVLVLCSTSAKRYSGGSSRSRGSGSSWGSFGRSPSHTSFKPSAPSFHSTGNSKPSTSNFLYSESGRPSRPAPSMPSFSSPSGHRPSQPVHTSHSNSPPYPTGSHGSSPPYPTGSHGSSPPSHPTGFHSPSAPPANNHPTATGSNYGKPGVVHDQHQQTSAHASHSDPYGKQPAQNPHVSNAPYVPSGGYSPSGNIPAAPHGISVPTFAGGHPPNSAPYPTNLPNHPHPNPSISSSSFPSNAHPPPYSPNAPIHPQNYPVSHNQYNPVHSGPPPPYGSPPNYGGSYNPMGNTHPYGQPSYHAPPPPAYQPASAPFVPGRTVYVVDGGHKSSGPGLGTVIAGGIAGGVAAGATNAIVDHAISSIFRPSSNHVHTYPSAPPVGTPTSTVTHTTNNYYYGQPGDNTNPAGNQGTAGAPVNQPGQPTANQPGAGQPAQGGAPQIPQAGAPASGGTQANPGVSYTPADSTGNPSSASNGVASRAPEGQPENPGVISDENIMKFTEELFDKQDTNLNQHVELNLQKRSSPNSQGTVPDEASEPLFTLKPELDTIPTVSTLRALYDNYQRDGTQKEIMTTERRNEENAFLDEIVKTPVMKRALDWLVDKKYIESDDFEQKDLLRRMWFNNFEGTSSGFERIFLSEKFGDSGIVGMQNWLYFANLESQKNVNYLGYVEITSLSGKGSLLKLNYQTEGFTMQNATIFVGTAPELELALYTVCFYARPNNWCPVSLGGAKFFILTHSFRYFGKDLIDLGFPAF